MKKFALIYIGGNPSTSKEEGEKVMAAWMAWFDEMGDAVVDGGFPFIVEGKVVGADGSVSNGNMDNAGGYSVLQAENFDAVVELAKGCPHLTAGGRIEIHEEMPMNG